MGVMYLAFFDASVALAVLSALAYFMYTFSQYRAAQAAQHARRHGKGARARSSMRPALATASTSPFARA